MSDPLVVGGEKFASKAALRKRAQDILHGPLRVLVGQEHEFVLDLLRRHRRAERKIGGGVSCIRVVQAPKWKQNHAFIVERVDGSTTDFSYLECISPSSSKKKFHAACRALVVHDVLEAKRLAFATGTSTPCPVTGERLTWDDCHVDHAEPMTFERLVADFVRDNSVDVDQAVDHDDEDHAYEQQLTDPILALRFILFHRKFAVLRVVSRRANLSVLRRSA